MRILDILFRVTTYAGSLLFFTILNKGIEKIFDSFAIV